MRLRSALVPLDRHLVFGCPYFSLAAAPRHRVQRVRMKPVTRRQLAGHRSPIEFLVAESSDGLRESQAFSPLGPLTLPWSSLSIERSEDLLETLSERGILEAESDSAQPDIGEHGVGPDVVSQDWTNH